MKSSGNLLFTQMGLSLFIHLTSPDPITSRPALVRYIWPAAASAPIPIAIPMIMARPTLYTCNMQHRSTGKYNVNFTALNNKSIFKMQSQMISVRFK